MESSCRCVFEAQNDYFFFFKQEKQFTLLAAIFCLLCTIMGALVFTASQIGFFSTPAEAC